MITDLRHPLLSRALRRRVRFDRAWRPWLVAWLGGPVIGIVNGVARETLYANAVGDSAAHQISTGTGAALFALYFWFLTGRWPLETRRDALTVGAVWVALMVAFEFGFGHSVDGTSWRDLARDWNLADGRLWPLLVLWVGAGPTVFRELRRRRS